ncbi:lysylphosphatidylglycerol synthase transmembrane domain-containing protein [Halomarina litorea]|uniref:lysylphosphatidylglycerol synthase transmembrane domain-containing protein n=1 Tax=Halomarina litorea TaxID=2961595 RepID=UPI0020C3A871|nr:lysylphosphatidylglycerol synthase transmembrane domain-containing protein [Halomarina sp. BCD28]
MQLKADTRTVVVGFVGGCLAFGLVFWLVGVDSVLSALRDARPRYLLGVLLAATVWLCSWGLSLRVVLGSLGERRGVFESLVVFAGATFANNVTPFGQAGGEPLSALLISRATDRDYEDGLATIASVDALHFVPTLTLGLLGLGFVATRITFGQRLEYVAATVLALAVVVPVGVYVGWTNRYRIERAVVRALTPVVRTVANALPVVSTPADDAVERRIEGFFESIERVGSDRRRLALAVGFSALGWVALATSLWLALASLGVSVPYLVTFLAVPVGDLAALAPTPGGLGGVEALLIGLLVAVSPAAVGTVSAAVLIHRAATYWLPTVVGGGAASVILTD